MCVAVGTFVFERLEGEGELVKWGRALKGSCAGMSGRWDSVACWEGGGEFGLGWKGSPGLAPAWGVRTEKLAKKEGSCCCSPCPLALGGGWLPPCPGWYSLPLAWGGGWLGWGAVLLLAWLAAPHPKALTWGGVSLLALGWLGWECSAMVPVCCSKGGKQKVKCSTAGPALVALSFGLVLGFSL